MSSAKPTHDPALGLVAGLVAERLAPGGRAWLAGALAELGHAADDPARDADRFSGLFALASRHARDARRLAPTERERAELGRAAGGLDPERWTLLEALRVALVLARPDLEAASGARAVEEAFRYADEGELRALYRALALLPAGERFRWRAGEGCRTNMRSVFEAVALDTPYPAQHFDEIAWRSVAIKCVFVGAPLWRLQGLDRRLSPELARVALDLADERRSAGRGVPHELWLCLGPHGGERGLESLLRELAPANQDRRARRAAAHGLGRAGARARAAELAAAEADPLVRAALREAGERPVEARSFRALDPSESP